MFVMMEIIAICLVLITVALIFGSDAAGELLGCFLKLIFLGVAIAVVGFIFLVFL
tara:strand:- start:8810 stop:8974 length:165 start_codon:yes stop_codon:yes gene_type:complete